MSNKDYKIEFADEQHHRFDRAPLLAAVEQILSDHGVIQSEISIAIVDDASIRRLNKQYLNHDFETDVISFLLSENETADSLCGQLVVSTETAMSISRKMETTFQDELLLYVVHGMLHLVGYDDTSPEAASEMRMHEKKYMAERGVEHRWSESEAGPC